jgi:hypothetical protein
MPNTAPPMAVTIRGDYNLASTVLMRAPIVIKDACRRNHISASTSCKPKEYAQRGCQSNQ